MTRRPLTHLLTVLFAAGLAALASVAPAGAIVAPPGNDLGPPSGTVGMRGSDDGILNEFEMDPLWVSWTAPADDPQRTDPDTVDLRLLIGGVADPDCTWNDVEALDGDNPIGYECRLLVRDAPEESAITFEAVWRDSRGKGSDPVSVTGTKRTVINSTITIDAVAIDNAGLADLSGTVSDPTAVTDTIAIFAFEEPGERLAGLVAQQWVRDNIATTAAWQITEMDTSELRDGTITFGAVIEDAWGNKDYVTATAEKKTRENLAANAAEDVVVFLGL